MSFEASASVTQAYVQALVDDMPSEPVVVNINVPDLPLDQIKGWRHTNVGLLPPRTVTEARLEPIAGDEGAFRVVMDWGEKVNVLPEDTDGGAVEAGYVSIANLTRMIHEDRTDVASAEAAVTTLIGHAPL